MVMSIYTFMGMAVRGLVFSMNVGMGVDMCMLVGMHQIAVPMHVVVDMGMFVDVL